MTCVPAPSQRVYLRSFRGSKTFLIKKIKIKSTSIQSDACNFQRIWKFISYTTCWILPILRELMWSREICDTATIINIINNNDISGFSHSFDDNMVNFEWKKTISLLDLIRAWTAVSTTFLVIRLSEHKLCSTRGWILGLCTFDITENVFWRRLYIIWRTLGIRQRIILRDYDIWLRIECNHFFLFLIFIYMAIGIWWHWTRQTRG